MTSRALRRTAALAAALLLSACSDGEPADTSASGSPSASGTVSSPDEAACGEVVDGVVAAAQRYVDLYGSEVTRARPSAEPPDLQQELEQAQSRLAALGCDAQSVAGSLTAGLEQIEASGALAEAVKGQLVASMTGRVGTAATTRSVGVDDDLRDVLPELAPGSTVRLTPGEHRLRDTVVLLQGVRLVGAGRGRTTLSSSAADAALLAVTQDRVDLSELTLRHVGDRPASLVVGAASTSLVLDRVAVVGASGAAGESGAGAQPTGGSGVLMAAGRGSDENRGTTLEVTDSVFRDNESAGILLSGDHVASVIRSSFVDGGQCGICFVGSSTGLVRDAGFSGGVTGLIAADQAAPLLVDSTVSGAEIGVQAVDRATPVVRRSTVGGASRAALLFGDRSGGRVESVTCRDNRFDIVVASRAVPFLGDNRCSVQPMG